MRVPLYREAFGKPIVKEKDSDFGQKGDGAGFHNRTLVSKDFDHIGPAPDALLPLHKDHGT